MSIIALYVYAPTTFKTDTKIEPMAGEPHAAGEVRLAPGIYRLPGNANISATHGAKAETDYAIVPITNDKGGWPDPPVKALLQHNQTPSEIKAFLASIGGENEIS